jgi:hypothetical protein
MPEKIIDSRREAERQINEGRVLRRIRRELAGKAQERKNELKPVTAEQAKKRGY